MTIVYHYCARSIQNGVETIIDGVATVNKPVETLEDYREFKQLVCANVADPAKTSLLSLSMLGSGKCMKEAFEAKYQRDWNDPAGNDMKAIWADAWAAAKGSC